MKRKQNKQALTQATRNLKNSTKFLIITGGIKGLVVNVSGNSGWNLVGSFFKQSDPLTVEVFKDLLEKRFPLKPVEGNTTERHDPSSNLGQASVDAVTDAFMVIISELSKSKQYESSTKERVGEKESKKEKSQGKPQG